MGIGKQLISEDINKDKEGSRLSDSNMKFGDIKNWDFRTDGNPPADKFNIASICLHELLYGLAMMGYGYDFKQVGGQNKATPVKSYYKSRFHVFLAFVTSDGRYCHVCSALNDLRKLDTVITGGNLWFSTSKRRIARLSAPRIYEPGSSIYRLDSEYYCGRRTIVPLMLSSPKHNCHSSHEENGAATE